MQDFRTVLIAKAFREIPAETYNQVLGELTADEWPPLMEAAASFWNPRRSSISSARWTA